MKPNAKVHIENYVRYIATRNGAEPAKESTNTMPAFETQQKLIKKLLKAYPDSENLFEHEDYLTNPTRENADELIMRIAEMHSELLGDREKYVKYIAERPHVEKLSSHGLFTDDGVPIILSDVAKEIAESESNIWTHIISLRREDAERLGYNSAEAWMNLIRANRNIIAQNMKIAPENFHWYAAFHNESHHPHIHMMAYSTNPNEAYLTKEGIREIKSLLAREIFKQDLLCVYKKQTEYRDELKSNSKNLIAEIISKINSGIYDNPNLEEMLLHLADRLSRTSGKKVYGYLKADVKAIIDSIVDEIASDNRISVLYDLWYEQRESVIKNYTDELPERVSLSQNKEFKSIRNAVIQEAMNILADRTVIEDEAKKRTPDAEAPEISVDADRTENEPTEQDGGYTAQSYRGKKKTWWTDEYKAARQFFYGTKEVPPDFVTAFALMRSEAEKGNGFAMHDIGKMFLSGLGCEKDEAQAQSWFTKAYNAFIAEEAVAEKKDYLQYRIGKLYSFGYGVELNYGQAAKWYRKAVAEDNPFAAYSLGSLYRRGQGVEQNDETAYRLYRRAAEHSEKPNAYAAYELGRMCKNGIGTVPDKTAAVRWYRQAYQGFLIIEQDIADDKLYYRLGQMNLNGIGTEVYLSQAKQYFEKAVKLDNADAFYGLGKLYLLKDSEYYDPKKAVDCLIEAAKRGHEYAQYTLGKLFLKGEEVPKNVDYALRWLNEAVEKENQYAEYLLGKTFLLGVDTVQDISRAEELLKCSANQGNAHAQYLLGKTYLEGVLFLQDIPEAVTLITESADQGFASAQYLLGKLLYKGEIIPQDLERAIDYLERATEQENSYAAYLAGKIRLTEDAVKDISKALCNFEIAAENGNDFSEYMLGKIYLYGKEVERDYDKAIVYLTASAEHGNQYAKQLLYSIRNNRNWSAAIGSLRLLGQLGRAIQQRLEDERKGKQNSVDRKLRRKIDEKKQAHGLKHG